MKDGRTGQGAGTQKTRKKERKEIQKQSWTWMTDWHFNREGQEIPHEYLVHFYLAYITIFSMYLKEWGVWEAREAWLGGWVCAPRLPKFQRSVNENESASVGTALISFLQLMIPVSECHGWKKGELLHLAPEKETAVLQLKRQTRWQFIREAFVI